MGASWSFGLSHNDKFPSVRKPVNPRRGPIPRIPQGNSRVLLSVPLAEQHKSVLKGEARTGLPRRLWLALQPARHHFGFQRIGAVAFKALERALSLATRRLNHRPLMVKTGQYLTLVQDCQDLSA